MEHIDIPEGSVRNIQSSTRCAACWEPVFVTYNSKDRTYNVKCITPGCNTPGLVSHQYVERRQAESRALLLLATSVLKNALAWVERPRKSIVELRRELGYQ